MLVNATVSWCSVSVNREVLKRLLSQVHDVEQGDRHGGPHVCAWGEHGDGQPFYGLTHQEVALRRDILGLPKRKGGIRCSTRRRTPALWEHWKAGVTERHIALDDDMAMLG